jgi:hypothetical protein
MLCFPATVTVPGLFWMFELPVAPFCSRQIPTIFFKKPEEDLLDLVGK